APVAAFENRRPLARPNRLRPFVDVAGHVVYAERTFAARSRSRCDALPEAVHLGLRGGSAARPQRAFVERAPWLVDDARLCVAHVAIRVRHRLVPLAGERPLGFVAEALAEPGAQIARLVPRDQDDGIGALLVRVLESVDAEVHRFRGQLTRRREPL